MSARPAASPEPREPHHRRWIWAVYAVLFAASVPWYLPRDGTPALWWGLPYWVVLSLSATLLIALFTVWVIRRHWEDDDPSSEGESTE